MRYMSSLFTTGYMNEVQSVRLAGLMEVSSNVERISDSCASIAHKIKSKVEKQQNFSNMALEELSESFELVESMVDKVTDVLKNNDANAAVRVLEMENQVNQLEHRLRKKHLGRLNEGVCTPEMTVVYTEILHNLERIGDCCAHIAVFVLEYQKDTAAPKAAVVQ